MRSMRPYMLALAVWGIVVLSVAQIGSNPRKFGELTIGGGYGEAVDGGIDFEKDGDILTDGDLTVGGTVSITMTEAELETILTDVADVYTNNDAVITAGTTLSAGVDDVTQGTLNLYAHATSGAGRLRLYNEADVDGIVNYWQFLANNLGQLVLEMDTGADIFTVEADGDVWWHNTVFMLDDQSLTFGSSGDFHVRYDEAGDDRLEITDSTDTNLMMTLTDAGTTGNLGVTGDIIVDGGDIGITADPDLIGLASGTATIRGTLAATTVTGINVTSGADPGHTHTGGALSVAWESAVVNYDDSSPLALFTVADGYRITDIEIEVTTIWNGTTGDFSVGDGTNNRGFVSDIAYLDNAELGTTGYKISSGEDMGVYLSNDLGGANYTSQMKTYAGADTIDAYITVGDSGQGVATVWIKIERLK